MSIVDGINEVMVKESGQDVPQKNPHAAALGYLGGKKGGLARAMSLSAERRREIAQKAAEARWHRSQGTPLGVAPDGQP